MKIKINNQAINTNVYATIQRIRELNKQDKVTLTIEVDSYTPTLDRIIAFGTVQGIDINLNINNNITQIPAFASINSNAYRNLSNRDVVYNYVNKVLADVKSEHSFYQDAVQRAREYADAQNLKVTHDNKQYSFKVTEEVRHIVETYAQAYGFNRLRFDELPVTSDSFSNKVHTTLYTEWVDQGLSDEEINRRIKSWELKERQRLKPTPISDIKRVYESISYYLKNNIPYEDGYVDCPLCLKPFRQSKNGITELAEDVWCTECSPLLNNQYITDTPDETISAHKQELLRTAKVVVSTVIDVYSLKDWTQEQQ